MCGREGGLAVATSTRPEAVKKRETEDPGDSARRSAVATTTEFQRKCERAQTQGGAVAGAVVAAVVVVVVAARGVVVDSRARQ